MLALVVDKLDSKFFCEVKEVPLPSCDENEIIIKTTYSSINYKDALSSIGNTGVTKNFPHITGIDLVGIVYESKSKLFEKGQRVLVSGYDLGMNTNGGHSQFVKVPDSWVIKAPQNLSDKELMAYGTAGLTASLSISELIKNLPNNAKDILVTGASGGVASIAIMILKNLGFNVTAVSSKEDKDGYLKGLGINKIIRKDDFLKDLNKALLSAKYDALIDTVGGDILALALKQIKYNGVATCCGLSYSSSLNVNVFPFILRAIRLIGIDSVECSLEKKEEEWLNLANKYRIKDLEKITKELTLEQVKECFQEMLEGKTKGRYIVRID